MDGLALLNLIPTVWWWLLLVRLLLGVLVVELFPRLRRGLPTTGGAGSSGSAADSSCGSGLGSTSDGDSKISWNTLQYRIKHESGTSMSLSFIFLPSSLSLYKSGSAVPLWWMLTSVWTTSGTGSWVALLSSSFCSFLSYKLLVDAGRTSTKESLINCLSVLITYLEH